MVPRTPPGGIPEHKAVSKPLKSHSGGLTATGGLVNQAGSSVPEALRTTQQYLGYPDLYLKVRHFGETTRSKWVDVRLEY